MKTAKLLFDALQGMSIKQQRQLSEQSGVPFRTLYKIKRGITADPKSSTVDRLMEALNSHVRPPAQKNNQRFPTR